MSETANRLEDVEKTISAEDAALEEVRRRHRETLRICGNFGGASPSGCTTRCSAEPTPTSTSSWR